MGGVRPVNIKYRRAFIIPRRSMLVPGSGPRIKSYVPVIKTGARKMDLTDLSKKLQNLSHSAKINPYSVRNILSADPKMSTSLDNMENIIKAFSDFQAARRSRQNKPSLDTKAEYCKRKVEIVQLLSFLGRGVPYFLHESDETAAKEIEKTLKLMKKLPQV